MKMVIPRRGILDTLHVYNDTTHLTIWRALALHLGWDLGKSTYLGCFRGLESGCNCREEEEEDEGEGEETRTCSTY